MKEIEDFLRETRPVPDDKPTFILETKNRLEAVEGIKAEVDRQRHHGRVALIVALALGLAVGVLATAIAFLYPVDAQAAGEGLWEGLCTQLHTYRQYLMLPVAILAITLAVVVSRKSYSSSL